MPDRDMFVEELAATVDKMFADEVNDPSAKEIARYHFPDRTLPGDIIESVRKRLGKVRDVLEEHYDHAVFLLNKTYYLRYRDESPETEADANRCVAGIGQGAKQEGLGRQTDDLEGSDLLWKAMANQNLKAGSGKVVKGIDRAIQAVADGRMDKKEVQKLIKQRLDKAAERRDELEKATAPALPAGSDEE